MARLLLLFFMSVFAWQIATVGSFMWMRVTRVSHPSQTPALALSRPLSDRVVRSSVSGAGQLVKGVFCRLLGVCPRRPAVLILSPVAPSVIWPCDLHHFPLTYRGDCPGRSPVPSQLLSTSYFQDNLISLSQCKIAPDICDYSKPLNCLFLLHLLGCDRLSFIFTATLHLLFLSGGLFMFVSVRRKPRLAGIHQCALS